MSHADKIKEAVDLIRRAARVTVFSGAGISVESGIPPFRGPQGLWSRYNPEVLDIDYFLNHPAECWRIIKKLFYEYFAVARPNEAHRVIARMEDAGYVQTVITQNIDNLHQEAGSKNVYEYHGNSKRLVCLQCSAFTPARAVSLDTLPPVCPGCGGLLKPDFIFFGEAIPLAAARQAEYEVGESDLFLVVGSTGEVLPAAAVPYRAYQNGAKIIEINPNRTNFTEDITSLFLKGKATRMLTLLAKMLNLDPQ